MKVLSFPTEAEPTPELEPQPESMGLVLDFPKGVTRDDVRRKVTQGRLYIWPPSSAEPIEYLSVTSALNSLPKEWLGAWSARVVAETAVTKRDLLAELIDDDPDEAVRWLKGAPWSQRDRAAAAGSTIHTIAEMDCLGHHDTADALMADLDAVAQAKAMQVRDFFARVPLQLVAVESIVFSDKHRYAGTIDFICEFTDPSVTTMLPFPPGNVVVDLKTGAGVYPETALQLAAYRAAQTIADLDRIERNEMVPTTGGAVLHVTEKSWALHPMDTDTETFEVFLAALAMAKRLPLDSNMVGPAVVRGRKTIIE